MVSPRNIRFFALVPPKIRARIIAAVKSGEIGLVFRRKPKVDVIEDPEGGIQLPSREEWKRQQMKDQHRDPNEPMCVGLRGPPSHQRQMDRAFTRLLENMEKKPT